MVFSIHPAYGSETFYVTVCDSFLVGPRGVSERLHKTPQILFEIP